MNSHLCMEKKVLQDQIQNNALEQKYWAQRPHHSWIHIEDKITKYFKLRKY